MKKSIFFGVIFLLLGGLFFYLQRDDYSDLDNLVIFIPGILLGIGFGIILGAIIGYRSKSQSVKEKELKTEAKAEEKPTV